jgi:peptidoglycan lytic transglycosylase
MRIRVEARQLRRVRWGAAGLFAAFLALAAGGRAVCEDAHRFEAPPVLRGDATYYADFFHGRESASGEIFDQHKMVAAHRSLPFGSHVRVINVKNGRSVNVRIVDRGPYGQNYREGTIIDLSKAAARKLRMIRDGQVRVKVVVLSIGDGKRRDS